MADAPWRETGVGHARSAQRRWDRNLGEIPGGSLPQRSRRGPLPCLRHTHSNDFKAAAVNGGCNCATPTSLRNRLESGPGLPGTPDSLLRKTGFPESRRSRLSGAGLFMYRLMPALKLLKNFLKNFLAMAKCSRYSYARNYVHPSTIAAADRGTNCPGGGAWL